MAHSVARDEADITGTDTDPAREAPTGVGRAASADGIQKGADQDGIREQADQDDPRGASDPGRSTGRPSRWRWLTNSGTIAVLTWLLATPVAFWLPTLTERDPFSVGASSVPIAAALCLIVGLGLLAVRWSGEVVAGVAAGLTAAWTVLMLRLALVGTPFGFGGLQGDSGRMAASATRYTTTIASADALDPRLPSEYPPLYTWLIGRAGVLLDQPGWRLLADFEVLFFSAALVAGFVLWRRLVPSWLALAITVLGVITWSDPRKAYEVLTLAIFVPWALDLFARTPAKRLHWLPAGLLGGIIAVVYQAWVVYAALGLVALMVVAWRTEPDRWAYLRRIGLAALVAFIVSSWYIVPFVWTSFTKGGEQISDLYASTSINAGLFPFLDVSPIGLLQLAGLIGMIFLFRTVWWARPLLLLVAAVYAYRLLSLVRYVLTDHTGFLHYTTRFYSVLFTVAGVLTVVHVAPLVTRALRITPPRLVGVGVMAVLLAWSATGFTRSWMPEHESRYAVQAHAEPLPGGGYPVFAPEEDRPRWFPVYEVRDAVEGVLGPDPRRLTLSVDSRLYAYLPWPGYLDTDPIASATLAFGSDRRKAVRELADTDDPDAFARRSADTGFGSIDVFVLRERESDWAWSNLSFQPEQFDPRYWAVVDDLPENIVVVVRRE
ncbi:arabinofuranosyltransferase [Plantactinospora sp. GCM10030261]|uniref:arabinofuranosyltransferase n=1 Tax=Plantactinospora sp. GCM10030261 TaxID=3273420 RepID=UPI00361C58C9